MSDNEINAVPTPSENESDLEQADQAETLQLNSEIEQTSACERHIKVTVPREEVDRYFAKEFDELTETAYVPGFRAGKAPRALVEKRFRKEVADRVKSSLVLDALGQINADPNLTPISEPDLDYNSLFLLESGPFVFEFNLEVRPEFDLPEWKGLVIEKPTREFGSDDIDRSVERILASYGRLEAKTEPAESGDYVVTALRFDDGDTLVSSVENETIRVRPTLSFHDGSIKGFDQLMAGVKAGETRTTEIVLSDDAANPDLRGKTLTATFTVKEVKQLKVRDLSAETLEQLGGFENVGDFRDAVLDILKRQLEHEQHRRARRQITEKLTVAADWELPPGLLKRQSEREIRRAIMELQRSGYSNEDIQSQMNLLRQNSSAATAQALKEHFILEKIAEIENIEESQEDYDSEIALIAAQSGMTPRRVRAQLEKQGEMDILRNQIVERKVIQVILDNATFTEVPFELDEPVDEAIDLAVGGQESDIAEADAEDLKAVGREQVEKKMIDPNARA